LLLLWSPWVPAFSRIFPAVAYALDVAGSHPYTVANLSAVTGVTAVACNLAIIVEVGFDPAVRNNLASVGVSIVPSFHGVFVAVLQATLMLHGLTVVSARPLLLFLHDVFLLDSLSLKIAFLFKIV
jgi:hypothetical protein